MQFKVTSNIKQVQKSMGRIRKDQVPFATSLALNMTADDVAKAITAQMPQKLDRPTPFTLAAYMTKKGRFKGKRASKRNLVAVLIPGEAQAKYLELQVFGGTRTPAGSALAVPFTKNARLNKYGNVPNRRGGLIKKKSQFIATIKGIEGIWERYGRGGKKIKLIHAFESEADYQPRLPIFKIAGGVIRNRLGRNFRVAYARAIRP